MKHFERIQEITRILETEGNASTVFLAKTFNVSESSIRRDINDILSSNNRIQLKRIHGGVILQDRKLEGIEYMFELKLALNSNLKTALAREAVRHIENGDHIILDSGSTCYYLAQHLHQKKGLCVMTLDVKIAEELGKYRDIESSIIGGLIRPGYYTVGGIRALENLDQFTANKVFMSLDAIDVEHGITNASEFEVGVKQKLIRMGKNVYVLADHTKFNSHTLYKVADISVINTIITNKELDEHYADLVRSKGVNLIRV
jgi:DeoR/GlpR family transcriptional regulator of sugar metabolism